MPRGSALPECPAVQVTSLAKQVPGGPKVLAGLALRVEPGSILAILGPSGCGKSTLLRLIAGLDRPDGGEVMVFGAAPRSQLRRGDIALLSSESALLPWRSALENIRLPLDLLGGRRGTSNDAARRLLTQMRMGDLAGRLPHELSDGQRQRLRLAQALVSEPSLLLLDEPFTAVDEGLRRVLIDNVTAYVKADPRRAAILITHNAFEAASMADEVLILSGQPMMLSYHEIITLPAGQRGDDAVTAIVREVGRRLVDIAERAATACSHP